jgi:hypothetical protein
MYRENKKYGMKSFFTLASEWVAKDGTSVGFPRSIYSQCDEFAPDRSNACDGKLKEKDKQGRQIELRCSDEHPTQNGKHVGAGYNVDLVTASRMRASAAPIRAASTSSRSTTSRCCTGRPPGHVVQGSPPTNSGTTRGSTPS